MGKYLGPLAKLKLQSRRMRYLLLSDVHANAGALERVLTHAQGHGWDRVISLGDTVGYGDEAEATLDRLRALTPYVALRGNHEAALLKALSSDRARRVAPNYERTREQGWALSEANRSFIEAMTLSHLDDTWGAVHGALRDPWEYLLSVPVARANAPLMARPLYFVGHTHIPALFTRDISERWYGLVCRSESLAFSLKEGSAAFVNPGSVGQPRDGLGPSYGIYDDEAQRVDLLRLTP